MSDGRSIIEKLFGTPVSHDLLEPDEENNVETLNAADYDGEVFIPTVQSTILDPVVIVAVAPIPTLEVPSQSFSTQRYRLAVNNGSGVVQIANQNRFRVRMWITCSAASNTPAIGTKEQLSSITEVGASVLAPYLFGGSQYNAFPLHTTAEVYAMNPSNLVCDFTVVQEFVDG